MKKLFYILFFIMLASGIHSCKAFEEYMLSGEPIQSDTTIVDTCIICSPQN